MTATRSHRYRSGIFSSIAFTLGLALCAGAPSAAPAHAAGKGETMAAAPMADLPPPPPSQAMQDKFRKLQKEMESGANAPAASANAKPAGGQPMTGVAVGSLAMQIFFGLAFVLLLAVVTIRVLKRMQGRFLSKSGKGGDIFEVLETCHLGARQRVVALRMNDEVGIVGVTQNGISLLTVLKEPAEDMRRSREGNSAAFSENLNKLLDRFKKPKKVSEMLEEGAA